MYLIFLQDQIYHSGTLCSLMVASHSSRSPFPFRTLSIMVKARLLSTPILIR
ncbi:hypothetical protein EVA_15777 [gut metagenome]|uniref:Uncharacterized protein n=1 Tax=gut metagenome TaxID=749906 RepID=J9FMH4_9ZZZZ